MGITVRFAHTVANSYLLDIYFILYSLLFTNLALVFAITSSCVVFCHTLYKMLRYLWLGPINNAFYTLSPYLLICVLIFFAIFLILDCGLYSTLILFYVPNYGCVILELSINEQIMVIRCVIDS